MHSTTATIVENQSCHRCGSTNLHTRIEPPHVALRCKDCGAWQQWVSKAKARAITDAQRLSPRAKAYPQAAESIRPDFTPPTDLVDRVDRLEAEIAKINQQLLFHVRILGQAPAAKRRTRDSFEREITDTQIAAFNRTVGGEE